MAAVTRTDVQATATSRGIDQGEFHQLSRGAYGGQFDQTTSPCLTR